MLRRVSRQVLPSAVARFGTAFFAGSSALRWQSSNGRGNPALSATPVLRQAPHSVSAAGSLVNFTKSAPHRFPRTNPNKVVTKVRPNPQDTAWFGLPKNEPLWVRKPYLALWEAVKERLTLTHPSGLIVIGNPGIGKSVGAINTIAALSIRDDAKRLVVVVVNEKRYIFVDGFWHQAPKSMPPLHDAFVALEAIAPRIPVARGLSRPQLLLLHDVKSAKGGQSFPYQSGFVSDLVNRRL